MNNAAAPNLLMKTLRLTWWHLGVWFVFALLAGGVAVQACLGYNKEAGTDKTPGHIAVIAAAVVAGPLVGPVANPAATGIRASTWRLTALLGVGMLGVLVPFMVLKRPVSMLAFGVAWSAFVVASAAWFLGALVSLGVHLS